ncbi:hypothetical protein Tco_0250397 [Tanacetum coccineum]
MKEQAYNIIKTKGSRTQRQSNLKKFKEARFKISPQEFEDHTLGEIVSLKIWRVAKCAIELEEHKIGYKPRNAIKAQVLADFLVETQKEDEETDYQSQEDKTKNTGWKLYTDKTSSDDGSEAGLMIVSP